MPNIFFDLYGTLVDINTDEHKAEVWKELEMFFARHKIIVPNLEERFTNNIVNIENSLKDYDIVDVFMNLTGASKKIATQASILFREKSINWIRLFDNALELLKTLKKRGYNLYLLSNAQAVFTTLELKTLGIYDMFDKIFISSDYQVKKPNLAFYKLALEQTKSLPSESMMIGNDYINDIAPARELGLKTIFIYTEGQTPSSSHLADVPKFDYIRILKLIDERFNKS